VPVLAAVLVLDLGLNRQQPLIEILRGRGWIYAVLGGLVLLTYWQRKQWLDALDRRFFRDRYDAQRVLREILKEIREARTFEQVAPRVVAKIETALHSQFVSIIVREPNDLDYHSLACVPSGNTPPAIFADSKLVALVRVIGKPLEVLLAASSWLEHRLPDEEIQFVRHSRIDLLVPIAMIPGRTEALLVLGIKRSEEPYTHEDQELLETIASSLALLLEKPEHAAEPTSVMFGECPDCGRCYDTSSATCTAEGAAVMPIRLQRTLAGRYRLDRRRGRGGMGTVYEATDVALERRVAVKVIREDLISSPEAAQRFRRESLATAGFSHPNVVTVHDYGIEAGTRAFLVMELLRGVTLRDERTRLKHLSPDRTLEIFRGVCAAVDAAHHRQLIHRDLKPENIFLTRMEEGKGEIVKVLDFGIAKFLTAHDGDAPTQAAAETGTGVLVGTLAYMSPEQLLGENPSVLWDLWALAVIAYEMLAGEMPFTTASTSDWRRNVLSGSFAPIRNHVAEAPPAWQAFFEECLASDRAKRPASIGDFWGKLEACLATPQSS
jgi:serine/threonine-protein kinase